MRKGGRDERSEFAVDASAGAEDLYEVGVSARD
jgi:hypothetical protein